ncbi:MAG: 23S rRNA (uracil(1939)-C(5))-methyltransferase RlmD [Symploca sp. SIO3C6]|uniref:23S rRNA (Uracil(1939)-C(5))-methyltransferase RlmD n=1 Tax=Symploca sp. SIO1C4 TaxID=2607765 RepID=A0A6B3NLW9_9CYAN|nr:23S rRNA (uracil(1939)-C(5))-methyltransferase RlmD [Symploca sp. SIO3C6]NER30561.1 23S rRNA (uracil(1939)-C(5))-methyltransferase RlmD [Symploca sp. SIO1C4]NET04565.1 23S rRNA (uracil(1939)-C(5))-methyltransferase RlmD [Symploca sp. SIO2B6]NET48996.1 23S rRNA (uracil(1939)-C(5))-methyltransferase RlmD [Merismopedia sp. SIO2A8]
MITNDSTPNLWQQGQLVELMITDLSDTGDGVGRLAGRVVFVPDTVTGDYALVRLVRVKPKYAYGKLQQILEKSPHRQRPHCIVADKCGGCQWQHITDEHQGAAKHKLVVEALKRIGGFTQPQVAPIMRTEASLGYRNKATYPLKRSSTGTVQAGYYRKGSHQLINLNQCPVQDPRLNPMLAQIKQDIGQLGWSVYDESRHQGKLRHLSLRIGRRSGEILLTLVTTDPNLTDVEAQAQKWLSQYPQLVGVCLNCNPKRTNAIFGSHTYCLAGQPYLREYFAGIEFQLLPETFFQINTEAAEALLNVIIEQLSLGDTQLLVDAYCGVGTFTLPLAKRVRQVIGLEVQSAAVQQAQINAEINGITNVEFHIGAVEQLLPQLGSKPDIVLLDPPRTGCEPAVIEALLTISPRQIVYVSCKAATLARDLKLLCARGGYQLGLVQPADFFPKTSHVECVAFLFL